MRAFHADVILATGGFVSAPVIWAASFEKTPVVIYLPDLEPGWAIRILAQWAKKVAVSFPEVTAYFPRERVVVTGYPVRAEFYQADSTPAREHFQLNPRERVVTIFGGSRGAHSINLAVAENLRALVDLAQILHITGPADERAFQDQRAALPDPARYRVFGYLDDEMHLALAAADVVIARAGAATVGEFPAVGVPSILVPYPYAGLHQDKNAEYLVSRGASVRIADAALGRELVPTLAGLLNDDARREKMRAAAKALAVPDAAERIGALIWEAAKLVQELNS
jgi:UDP-N-acetylglucosamine--N-acetylmuramyl-(pentapeptide) pyrophosphoryl-undecaprenol N-acetylglucosamine transferase